MLSSMSEERPALERRVSGRVEEILTGWWRLEGSKFQRCKTLDVGMDGALIVVDEKIDESTRFELHLDMESDWSASLSATVLWQRPIFFGKQQLTAVSYRFEKPSDRSMFGLWVQRKLKASSPGSEVHTAPVVLSQPKPELEPSIEPAPKLHLVESGWKKTLSQLTSKIPWFESEPLPNERRQESRGQVGLKIRCETEDEIFSAEFLNVSLSGVCLFAPSPSDKPGQHLMVEKGKRLELLLPENNLLLGGRRLTAQVVWSQQAGLEGGESAEGPALTRGTVMGLRFKESPSVTRKTFVGDLLRRINYNVRQVRSELRFPREVPVLVELRERERVRGVTSDISAGGAQLWLPEEIETPCNCVVHLDIGEEERLVHTVAISARLLRRSVDNEGRNCYAVAFRKGQTHERLELSRWLSSQMRVQDLDELIPNFSVSSGGDLND